jgi:Flp pilus assembly protein TadG
MKRMRSTLLPDRRLHSRHFRRRRRASTLIEMIFCLLVLFYLVMGGIEFGYFMFAKHVVQSAARDGARAAIVSGAAQSDATTAISNTMTNAAMQSSGYTYTIKNASTNATISDVSTVAKGTGIKVTVSLNFGNLNIRPLGVIASTKPVTATTTLVKE